MTRRRQTVALLSLLLTGGACALIPASRQDDHAGRIARPKVEKTAMRRREGSDVTAPNESDPGWVRLLTPCERADSAANGPVVGDCRRIGDQKVDSLRAPIDTATKKRP